jgi:hypothetical protein
MLMIAVGLHCPHVPRSKVSALKKRFLTILTDAALLPSRMKATGFETSIEDFATCMPD